MDQRKVPKQADLEYCRECDEPTGRAGIDDDSLFLGDGYGPLCPTCYHILTNRLALGEEAKNE